MRPWIRRLAIYLLLSAGTSVFLISRFPSRAEIAAKFESFRISPSLVDESPRDIRVCAQLGQLKAVATSPDGTPANYTIADFFGADRSDSVMEAYRVPVRAFVQQPLVAPLFREIATPAPAFESFSAKAAFYRRAAHALIESFIVRRKFERLGDRANHLAAVAKIALLKPTFREEPKFRDFCQKLQSEEIGISAATLREERSTLLEWIAAAGVTPTEVQFDPEVWTRFHVEKNGARLALQMTSGEPPSD